MGELEKTAHSYKDELLNQLKDQYDRERTKNEKIFVEYAKLKEKYLNLLRKLKGDHVDGSHIQEKEEIAKAKTKNSSKKKKLIEMKPVT